MKVYTSGQEIVAGVRAPEAFTSRGGLNGGMLISGSIAQTNSFCQQMGGRKGAFRVVGKNGTGIIRWKATGGSGGIRFEVTQ